MHNIEAKKKAISDKAELLRFIARQMPCLKNIIKSFDGKIYNCKFDKAVSVASNEQAHYYCTNTHGYFNILCSCQCNNIYDTCYILTGYSCKATKDTMHDIKDAMTIFDGKKIIADKMIALLNDKREALLKEAYDLDLAASNLDNIINRIEATRSLLNRMAAELPDAVRSVCGIKYYY